MLTYNHSYTISKVEIPSRFLLKEHKSSQWYCDYNQALNMEQRLQIRLGHFPITIGSVG